MSNQLALAGAQPQKAPRFAPIFTSRFFSGIWTNRSPLRDATTSRLVEKWYGAAGDAMIAGTNVEITNKLTLARRPGTSVFDSNSYNNVDRFYEFRLFNPTTEEIIVMVDQANALYSLIPNLSSPYNGTLSEVFAKNTGSGQSYMQSVGNSLYWGDGVDNKKWLQTLVTWSAGTQWGLAGSPFFTTFFIDPNGNIQQLTGTVIPITAIDISDNVLTVTSSNTLTNLLSANTEITFPASLTAVFLENQSVTIDTVTTNAFTALFTNPDYSAADSGNAISVGGGTPVSNVIPPIWSTTVPSSGNNFQGGITIDGSVQWTNRGLPVENWGIQPPTVPLTPVIGAAFEANWQANTFYSIASVVIDTNGNLQQVTTPGIAGSSVPSPWNSTLFGTTTDNEVTWTMIQTAAQLVWHSNYAYIPPFIISSVAAPVGTAAPYTGVITGGASNAYAGTYFLITGFPELANNGVFVCTASTATTLTLTNGNAVAQNATNTATAVTNQTIQYVVGNAAGTNCLFKLTPSAQPTLSGPVSAYIYTTQPGAPAAGAFPFSYPLSTGSAGASVTNLNSLEIVTISHLSEGSSWGFNTLDGAGNVTGVNDAFNSIGTPEWQFDWGLVILANIEVPVAGNVSFSINHHDGMFWGIGGGATLVSGFTNNPEGQTKTAVQGYPIMGGSNVTGTNEDYFVINCPTPGVYPVEINFCYWYHSGLQFSMLCNGKTLVTPTIVSGSAPPSWPGFSTSYAPAYATVSESQGNIVWSNIGPVSDFTWTAGDSYTLPDTIIIDSNGYYEAPFRSGFTSTTTPTFNTGLNNLTNDNPNLIWINEGLAGSLPTGVVSTFNGGWKYAIALVNSLDDTYSNCASLSSATGNFAGINSINFSPGEGLPPLESIDPQADQIAVFRTTDGQSVPFLIPDASNPSLGWTLSLANYIENGYADNTPDTGLNNLIEGAILGENTPPGAGAINLAYHLDRIWYSIGNVVYWTTGPATPCGNGINGTSPLNFSSMPSLVKRIVPTSSGAIIFTVSDIYIIQGNGTAQSPINAALPLIPGVGLLSYNALDFNGPTIGFFTTDNQFIILDPSSGVTYAGFPLGDQFRQNNGQPGTNWNPADVYVAWHVQGEDQAWYISDGTFGWYRLMTTPAPETGYTWSPFATITGGLNALQSVEVTPGVHRLLLGPTGTGELLQRDLSVFTDNGTSYPANAVIGSIVLAQPGQVAEVAHIVTDAVKVGTPLQIGFLADEALPYYTGAFDILKEWTSDPPELTPSRSLYSQRFYLCNTDDHSEAVMRHCQVKIIFSSTDSVQNELLTMTIFGCYSQEV